MTTPPAAAEREAFEAWARSKNWYLKTTSGGRFLNSSVDASWAAWQASAALHTPAATAAGVEMFDGMTPERAREIWRQKNPNDTLLDLIAASDHLPDSCRGDVVERIGEWVIKHSGAIIFKDICDECKGAGGTIHGVCIQCHGQGYLPYDPAALRTPAATAAGVDWVLVPREPTEAMIEAANLAAREYTTYQFGAGIPTIQQGPYDTYIAMLAAAPTPAADASKALTPEQVGEACPAFRTLCEKMRGRGDAPIVLAGDRPFVLVLDPQTEKPTNIFTGYAERDRFAQFDGFDSWDQLADFWRREHGEVREFRGVHIRWLEWPEGLR